MPRRLPFGSKGREGKGKEREWKKIKKREREKEEDTRVHTNSSKINEAGNCGVYGVYRCVTITAEMLAGYRVQRGYRLLGTEFRSHPSLEMVAFIFVILWISRMEKEGKSEDAGLPFFLEIEWDVWEEGGGRERGERTSWNEIWRLWESRWLRL